MATNTSVNSPLSGTTGTGNFVGATSPTVTTPTINGSALKQTLSNTTFTGATALSNGYYTQNATYTELAGYDFIDAGGSVPFARIAAYKTGAGSIIKMGTSNNYGSGITNTAVTIDQSGVVTLSSALPVSSGGTGVTSATAYAVLCGGTTSTGALQSVASVGTSGQVLTSNGAGALPTFKTLNTLSTVPTVQTFTSGSGTYTTPAGVKYIVVEVIGGGGGGNGIGVVTTAATAGGNSTFGTSLLTANGGAAGGNSAAPTGGAGGTATISSPAYGVAVTGNSGSSGVGVVNGTGGQGGGGFYGGSGNGKYTGVAGGNATGYGSGGGASGGNATSGAAGGGGAGGWLRATIASPSATYSYAVGAAGAGGVYSLLNGGNGSAGAVIVTEYYQ